MNDRPHRRRALGTVVTRVLCLLLLLEIPLWNEARSEEAPKQGTAKKDAEAPEKKEEEKPEPDRYLAVAGVTVHTMAGAVLEGTTVLSKNGKIVAIGRSVTIPDGAQTLDARGYHLYPGLIALRSSRLVGSGSPEDSTDVYGLYLELALAGGLTTVVSGNAAAKLTRGSVDDLLLKKNLFESIEYSTRNPSSRRKLREALERVRGHLRDLEDYERRKKTDPDAPKPDEKWIKGDYAKALRLMKHEATARANADSTHDIRAVCGLARHYDLQVVIEGAREGWTVADEMGRARVAAVISARDRVDPDERTNRPTGSTIQNARVLHEHGVPIAITATRSYISTGGMGGRDLQHLPLEAAFAVRGGLPDEAAIRAITIDAARILRLDHRIGSIEVGKDADFAITDGLLLHYLTHVRWTIVNGRVAYDQQKDTLFDHLHPESKPGAPPPRDHWPRSLGEEW